MKKILIAIFIVMLFSCSVFKAKKVNKIDFISKLKSSSSPESPMQIINANISADELAKWQRSFIQNVAMVCSNDDTKRNVKIQVILQPKGYPIINLSSYPAYYSSTRKEYENKLKGYPAPNTKYTPIAINFKLKFMGGIIKFAEKTKPKINPLAVQQMASFKKLKLSKFTKIQNVTKNQIIPTVIQVIKNKNTVSSIKLAKKLSADFNQNLANLPEFWQCFIEDDVTNLNIPLLLILQAINQQQYDLARIYMFAFSPFISGTSAASYYFGELGNYIHDLDKEFNEYLQKNGYKKALELNPKSATLWHSILKKDFYTKNEIELNKEYYKNVYQNNHLFPNMLVSLTANQLYNKSLRLKLNDYFNQNPSKSNSMKIAYTLFGLEKYDVAAILFWNSIKASKTKDVEQDLLENFLYCLNSYGIKGLGKVFDIDAKGLFEEIKSQQQAVKKQYALYSAANLKNKNYQQYLQDGISCLLANEYSWAIKNFSKGIKLKPKSFDLYSYRGLAYSKMKLYKKANDDFDRASRLKPKDVKTKLGIIELKFISKDYLGCYNMAQSTLMLTSKPNQKALCYFFMLISNNMQNKDNDNASLLFKKAIKQKFLFENWSFSLFEDWVENSKLSNSKKRFIKNAIDDLKDGHY